MKRVLLFLALLQGGLALAVDTPTPTGTPDLNSVRRESTDQAFYKAMLTILPSAVPTAYTTPQFVNSQPMRAIDVVNNSDCDVVVSLDGGGADNFIVPQKSALTIDVAKYKLHHARNVNIRGQAACSAGNVYIGAIF